MDYIKAVELARKGDNEGITFLYQETYQKSYYVALKYMKNEQSAEDVLQDAYIRAFKNLHQLQDANKFESWFRMIVANQAKNELVKNKPDLFSEEDMEAVLDNGTPFESDRVKNIPELAVDQKETSRLIQEMMAELSDEQRICITMFYVEEMSVKEIAEALDVSENTVKSRLNYGRTKIKDKVLELEKKGTKLYGMLPLVFFFVLFKKDAMACEAKIPSVLSITKAVNASKSVGVVEATNTQSVVKGITIAGKTISIRALIAGVIAAVVIIGGVTVANMPSQTPDSVQVEETQEGQLDAIETEEVMPEDSGLEEVAPVEESVEEEPVEETIEEVEEEPVVVNEWTGHYQMDPSIDMWFVLDIDESSSGRFEYGDMNGTVTPISGQSNQFKLYNNEFSIGWILTLSDNGNGTYTAKMIDTSSPYLEEEWILEKK